MADLSELLRKASERRGLTGSVRLTGEDATRALDALAEHDLAKRLAEEAASASQQGEQQPAEAVNLRRSTMTASQKSQYIRERGIERYQQLKP